MIFTEKLSRFARRARQDSEPNSHAEDQESLLSSHSVDNEPFASIVAQTGRVRRHIFLNYALATLLTGSLIINGLAWMKWSNTSLEKLCYHQMSAFPSPVDKDVEPIFNLEYVNGSFTKQTVYRRPASPEVDAAWNEIGAHLLPFAVPEDEGERYGLVADQVKLIPEIGGGYPAVLGVSHNIHCLNVLRQASHWDYDYYRADGKKHVTLFSGPEEGVRTHFSHCLDMLRQRLMCAADITPMGQVWVEGYGPLVFDTVQRKCRDYDQVLNWARERQMPDGTRTVRIREGDMVYKEWP